MKLTITDPANCGENERKEVWIHSSDGCPNCNEEYEDVFQQEISGNTRICLSCNTTFIIHASETVDSRIAKLLEQQLIEQDAINKRMDSYCKERGIARFDVSKIANMMLSDYSQKLGIVKFANDQLDKESK